MRQVGATRSATSNSCARQKVRRLRIRRPRRVWPPSGASIGMRRSFRTVAHVARKACCEGGSLCWSPAGAVRLHARRPAGGSRQASFLSGEGSSGAFRRRAARNGDEGRRNPTASRSRCQRRMIGSSLSAVAVEGFSNTKATCRGESLPLGTGDTDTHRRLKTTAVFMMVLPDRGCCSRVPFFDSTRPYAAQAEVEVS